MSLSSESKSEIIKEYSRGDRDTGSSEVQIAILTKRIPELTDHFSEHKKDHHSMLKLSNAWAYAVNYQNLKQIKYKSINSEINQKRIPVWGPINHHRNR